MKFSQLKQHIEEKNFSPLYVAAGEDSYLIKKAEEMLSQIIKVKELNVSYLPEQAKMDEVLSIVQTLPFLSDYRLVIGSALHLPLLKDYLKKPQKEVIIFLRGEKKIKVSPPAQLIDCDRLDTNVIAKSIAYECQKNQAAITREGAITLSEYCCRYMGRVRNELNKLISACQGRIIQKEDVTRLVVPELEYKVFELSDAIVKKNSSAALSILDDMLSIGQSAAYQIFGLLYAHFKRLLAAALSPNDKNLSEYLSVKEFAIKSAIGQTKSFTQVKLKKLIDYLHKLDYDIKYGRINYKIGLETFVMCAIDEVA